MHKNMVESAKKAVAGEGVGSLKAMATNFTSNDGNAELKARLRQQTAVAQLGQLALANANLSTLLKQAASLVCQTLEVEFAQVWEFQKDGTTMCLQAGIGRQEGLANRVRVDRELQKQVENTRNFDEPLIVEELQTERRRSWSSLVPDGGLVSSISAIIVSVETDSSGVASKKSLLEVTKNLPTEETDNNLQKDGSGKMGGSTTDTKTPWHLFPDANNAPGNKRCRHWGVLVAHTAKNRTFTKDENLFLQAIANMLSQAIARCLSQEKLGLLASAVEYAEESILITTTQLESPGPEIVFVNPAFTKMTGYTAAEAIGKTPRILQGAKTDRVVLERLRKNLSQGEVFYGEAINYRKDGTEFYNEWHIEPIRNDCGGVTHYLAVQRDVSKRKEAERRLYYKAFHDSLTGLPNRALFMKRLGEAIAEAQKSAKEASSGSSAPENGTANRQTPEQFALLFLDLDRFKVINDSLGHMAGDRLLVAIARRLESCLRQQDTVARLGGDEFGILLKRVTDVNHVVSIAERIQKELKKPLVIDCTEIFPSGSIGIVFAGDRAPKKSEKTENRKPSELLRDADIAMYRAKARGKAGYAIFDPTMHEQALSRLQLENDLRRGLDRNELCLHYQPIVNLRTKQITGFEALVRWQHPERGTISPVKFIPLAEETGLILPLGWWVLENACRQLQRWQQMFPTHPGLTMNANLSGKQFLQTDLSERLEQILAETGIKGSKSKKINGCLKLEITESTIMENEEMVISMLEDFQALGIQLAIDDFGTGYSSLSRLYRFPINTLKIDRSFINLMGVEGEKNEIVQTIIALAHSLSKDIVAEGIETEAQLTTLNELKCEYGQGYLFSKPVDSEMATALLHQQ